MTRWQLLQANMYTLLHLAIHIAAFCYSYLHKPVQYRVLRQLLQTSLLHDAMQVTFKQQRQQSQAVVTCVCLPSI